MSMFKIWLQKTYIQISWNYRIFEIFMGRLENQLGKGTIRPSLCIFKPTNIYLIKI